MSLINPPIHTGILDYLNRFNQTFCLVKLESLNMCFTTELTLVDYILTSRFN